MRNSTELKLFLSWATAFSSCFSFNRYIAYLNSSCDTSHRSLAFNIVILGLRILTVEKDRLVCYAKVLRYTVCEQNVPTCTFAHMQDCSSVKRSHFCSATWQHRATQPVQTGSEGDGLQQMSRDLHLELVTSISVTEGRRKRRCFKWEARKRSLFYFLIIVTKTTENQMQWEDNAEKSLETC